MCKNTNLKLHVVGFVFWILLFGCSTLENVQVGDFLNKNQFAGLLKSPPPITTDFSDTKSAGALPTDLGNKEPMRLQAQPRTAGGGYLLAPGFYEMTARSYCLHAGSYGPTSGDGYLYAPLKGAKKEMIQALVKNASSQKNISQAAVQTLIWAVLAKTNFKNLSTDLKLAAAQLLSAQQLYELNGGALGLLPSSVIDKASESLPSAAKEALLVENKLRGLFEQGNATYQDFERIAVRTGAPPNGKEYASGEWSKSPNGYYVRYFPISYKQTRVQVYVPEASTGFRHGQAEFRYASYPDQTVAYDGTTDVAVPANTGAQRLQQSNDPVDDGGRPPPVPPKFDPCQDLPKEGIKDVSESDAEFEKRRRLPKDQQAEKAREAQEIQDLVRKVGVKPNQTTFEEMDQAGTAAIRYINGTSIKENVEYAGQIYQDPSNGKYYFSDPVREGVGTSDPKKSKVPGGMKVVGDYHTHGGDFKYTDEIFSFPDFTTGDLGDRGVAAKQNDGNAHYLGTPQGRIEKMVIPKNWDGNGPCSGRISVLN